jgi:hypothetical protein
MNKERMVKKLLKIKLLIILGIIYYIVSDLVKEEKAKLGAGK